MLVHLHVKNLALIEEAEATFGPGLNILTGETGAGKSILLGSIQLILGGKPSREMIRKNADFALVELLFQVENTKAAAGLAQMGIEMEEGEVLLSRRIADGRSVSKINGATCTVAQMKAAAALLLDLHGQHEHQSLLHPEKQLEILDAFGGETLVPALHQVKEAYHAYRKAHQALAALDMDEEKRLREQAFLEFEVQQIREADLKEGEDEVLERQYRRLSNGRRIASTLQEIHRLTGTDGGAADQTGTGVAQLSRITAYDEDLRSMETALSEIDGLLEDFNRELSAYLDSLVFDEEEFARVEERLDLINSLKAKYGQEIPIILDYCRVQGEKLETLRDYEAHLARAREESDRAKMELLALSEELTQKRKVLSEELAEKIRAALRELNFLDVRFEIVFARRKSFSERGIDEVEYRISTNPGESVHALSRVVSGGELSRIMLAIKAILADKDQIETLIFDEIDTGISGITAQRVAEKMGEIGTHRQVLCITHLPQIAAMADTHFEIEKQGDESGTRTHIHLLSPEETLHELARLLGGAPLTEAALENARELRRGALSKKIEMRRKEKE